MTDDMNEWERLIYEIPGMIDVRKDRSYKGVDFLSAGGDLIEVKGANPTPCNGTYFFHWARVEPEGKDYERLILVGKRERNRENEYVFFDLDREEVNEVIGVSLGIKLIRVSVYPRYLTDKNRFMTRRQFSYEEICDQYGEW